jgi:threonine dehydrogenase-like Zn-dependent dehydrogenase
MADRTLVVEAPGTVRVRQEPPAPVTDGRFRVETLYSGISTGTELSYVKGTNPMLAGGWDTELGLFRPGQPGAGYPVTKLGYMQVGRVVGSRSPAVHPGELVAMTYGHRTAHLADPLAERFVPLPAGLDPILGIYVAHLGPICANGLLHAAADRYGGQVRDLDDGVRGHRVAVIGAGVVGLLTALFAVIHGAAEVVVVDPTAERRAVAKALELETLDPGAEDVALALKTRWRHGPADRGADVVFQCRGQASALALALRLLRPQGTVIDLAFYQGGADEVRLGEEFHHNGLSLRCAQIGRVPQGLAGTWSRDRLSRATLDLLIERGAAVRAHLITTIVPFDAAPTLFADLAARRHGGLQAVLTCE